MRDEGLAPLPACWTLHSANTRLVEVLQSLLGERGIPYLTGRVWTADACTGDPGEDRAASLGGVCRGRDGSRCGGRGRGIRGVPLAQVLYGGDDLLGKNWITARVSQAEVRDSRDREGAVSAALRILVQLDLTLVSVATADRYPPRAR